jgi:hypothetical protein
MLQSLVVLTNTGDTLLERHYQDSLRSIVDSFIRVKDRVGIFSQVSSHVCIKVEVNDVIFLGITDSEAEASVVIELIYLLVDMLKQTLNKCDSESIRDRFSGVLMVIEELFEHGGPFTTQQHVLTHYLRKPGFFSRFSSMPKDERYLEEALSNEQITENNWRPRGLRYTMNEILIDVVEYLNATFDKHWNPIRYDLVGHVQVNASLSGMPDLSMYMHIPHPFLHHSFHHSVIPRKKRFEEEKVVAFTPMDSKFVVFKYMINDLLPQIPFRIVPSVDFEEEVLKIEIKVESRMVLNERPSVEDFRIGFGLSSSCGKPSIATNGGNLMIDGHRVAWNLGKLSLDKAMVLTGRVPVSREHMASVQATQIVLDVNFMVIGHSASGTRVEKVLAKGENYTPYKGARCVFHSGKFEVRAM